MRSKFEKTLLGRYLLFRRHAPTYLGLLRLNAAALAKFVLICLACAAVAWWLGARLFASGIVGVLVHGLFQALLNIDRTVGTWPLLQQITNWAEVERLAERRP